MTPIPITLERYAPDLDPLVAGRILALTSMVPSVKGWAGAPTARSLGISALAAACKGAARLEKIDSSARLFAGTNTKLYELSGTSWTDRTRAVGGDYALSTYTRWSFAQFGNVSLAASKSDILQFSSSGAFANVGASIPKIGIIETVGNFVLGFDINDQGALGPNEDNQQRWWCAAIGTYDNWTPSIANQCATATLRSTPGGVKAAKRFGTTIMAYKERSMFQGIYVGQPYVWDFREIPGEAGCLGIYAVVDIGTPENPIHIFMGAEDFYIYDGSRPLPIGYGIKNEVFGELDRDSASQVQALHDSINKRVFFFYPVSGGSVPDKCVVYNYQSQRWGRDNRAVEAVVRYAPPSVSYDGLGALYSTYNDFPNLSYDSAFAAPSNFLPGIFDNTHTLKTLDGSPTGGAMTLGEMGNSHEMTVLSRVSPRWLTRPSTADMTNYYKMATGDPLTTDLTTPMDSRGRFDLMREALWHKVAFNFAGPVELNTLDAEMIPGGGA